MPQIKVDRIVSFTSEDPVSLYPYLNLMNEFLQYSNLSRHSKLVISLPVTPPRNGNANLLEKSKPVLCYNWTNLI